MNDFITDSNGIQTLSQSPSGEAGIAIDGNFQTISSLIGTANSLIAALQATELLKANNLSNVASSRQRTGN